MRTLTGLLCLISASTAYASGDYALNATVSATWCGPVGGISACSTAVEGLQKNVVVPLNDCNYRGNAESCYGKWEGTRTLNGQSFFLKVTVEKRVYPDFQGSGSITQHLLTAAIKGDGARWRYLHVMTGDRSSLSDAVQIDGEEFSIGEGKTITPGLTLSRALP